MYTWVRFERDRDPTGEAGDGPFLLLGPFQYVQLMGPALHHDEGAPLATYHDGWWWLEPEHEVVALALDAGAARAYKHAVIFAADEEE